MSILETFARRNGTQTTDVRLDTIERQRTGAMMIVTKWTTSLICGMALCVSGCAALHPIPGVPVRYLPDELRSTDQVDRRTINLALLRQTPPSEHRIDTGDVLAVYVENILGRRNETTPFIQRQQGEETVPALGYQIPVREDGTISLPLVGTLSVRGLSVMQTEQLVRRAYTEDRQFLNPNGNRVLVTLQKPRAHRVLVIRQEGGGGDQQAGVLGAFNLGFSKRGTGRVVTLPVYRNDVLNALAETGGLPGLDAENAIYVIRNRNRSTAPHMPVLRGQSPGGRYGAMTAAPANVAPAAQWSEGGRYGVQPAAMQGGMTAPNYGPPSTPQSPSGDYRSTPPVGMPPASSKGVNIGPDWSLPSQSFQQTPSAIPAAPMLSPTSQGDYRQSAPQSMSPTPVYEGGPAYEGMRPESSGPMLSNDHLNQRYSAPTSIPPASMQPDVGQRYTRTPAGVAPSPAPTAMPQGSLLQPQVDPRMSPSLMAPTPSHLPHSAPNMFPPQAAPLDNSGWSQQPPLPQAGAFSSPQPQPELPLVPMQPAPHPQPGGWPTAQGLASPEFPVTEAPSMFGNLSALDGLTVDSPGVIRIPVRIGPQDQVDFSESDIVLEDGDIVFIEHRDTEVFYTGGLLGGGQYTLPRDYQIDLLEAISITQGGQNRQVSGGGNSQRSAGGISALNLDVSSSASDLVIIRKVGDGRQVNIKVNIYQLLRDPSQRILIEPGDFLMLQYTPGEAVLAFVERHLLEGALFGVAAAQLQSN